MTAHDVNAMEATRHKVGIVLSGGGVRGAAHVGVLKALQEEGLEPTALAGASSGAMVAAMYAARRSFNQTLDIFRDNAIFSWSYFGLARKPGLLDSERLLEGLHRALDNKTFDDVSRELHVVASNLLDGSSHYFHEGDLAVAVMASSAYPGVFSPVEIDGRWLTDGGVTNNLPLEPLLHRCDALIGCFVNPVEEMKLEQLQTTFSVTQRAFQISTTNTVRTKLDLCDFTVAPLEILDIGIFEFSRTNEAYEIGLTAGRELAKSVTEHL
ncbi:MAG: patatin-like phospholipase family protein, partial [Myxococcota bacterium]